MRPIEIIRKIAPHALPSYVQAFEKADVLFKTACVDTPARVAHFLAQTAHETGGYTITVESGNYTAERICAVWPHRFPTVEAATPFAHDSEKLFNNVYANRMGNGPPSSGDGYRFRGRGAMQTTGRESYEKYGFASNPDAVCESLKAALGEWVDKGCNTFADHDDIDMITKRINGGTIGLASRKEWYAKIRPLVSDVTLSSAPATSSGPSHSGVVIATAGAAGAAAHQAGLGTAGIIGVAILAFIAGACVIIWLNRKR